MPSDAIGPPFDSRMKAELVEALADLWDNIAAPEVKQLRPETVDLCRFVHQVRARGCGHGRGHHRRVVTAVVIIVVRVVRQ